MRPYNKYLAWELSTHPLADPDWKAEKALARLDGLLAGTPGYVREAFAAIDLACRAFDEQHAGRELSAVIDSWGDDLTLLRGAEAT